MPTIAESGFFPTEVCGRLRAAGQIEQWTRPSINPSGHRHHESGHFKADAKQVPIRGGFTAQQESGVVIDFGDTNVNEASGFNTGTVILTFNLGEVNSHPDSYFNIMQDSSGVGNFKAFNMRMWEGNLTAFTSPELTPTFYFQNSAEWRRNYNLQPFISGVEAFGVVSGVSVLPSSFPDCPNVFSKQNNSVFVSGNFKEKEFSHFLYVKGVFPSGNYLLGTYGGLGLDTFTVKFSYDYTALNANVIDPQDLKDIALFTPNPPPQISDINANISGHWRLNELVGNRVSEVEGFPGQSMDAVAQNAPTTCSGVIASGIHPSGIAMHGDGNGGTLRWAEVADATDTVNFAFDNPSGPVSFMYTGWVNFDNLTETIHGILGKWSTVSVSQRFQYRFEFGTETRKWSWVMRMPNSVDSIHQYHIMDEEIVANKWYFFAVGYDVNTNESILRIDNNPIDRKPVPDFTSGLIAAVAETKFGASHDTISAVGTESFLNGCLDSITLYRDTVPDNDILLQIYNKGVGYDWPFPTMKDLDFTMPPEVEMPFDPGLRKAATFVWDMNEASGFADIRPNTAPPNAINYPSGVLTFPGPVGDLLATSGIILNTRNEVPSGALSFRFNSPGASGYYQFGDILQTRMQTEHSYTLGCWVKLNSKDNHCSFVSKWNGSTSDQQYLIQYNVTEDKFKFNMSTTGSNNFEAATNFSPTIARWYGILCTFDTENDQIEIRVYDAETLATVTAQAAVVVELQEAGDDADFEIGATVDLDRYCDADIDNVWIWKRKLTTAEKTSWFGNGNGTEWNVWKARDA